MGLRLKFNLILLLVFIAGIATVAIVAHRYTEHAAIEEAQRATNLTLDATALGALSPRAAAALGSRLVEMTVREVMPGATSDRADRDVIASLQAGKDNQIADVVVAPNGDKRYLVARLIRQSSGPHIVRIATANLMPVSQGVKTALITLFSAVGAVFFAVFFALNVMLDRMIVRPVSEMAKAADAVSTGDFSVAEFSGKSTDEIGVLGVAFNRMRRSTEEAIKLIKDDEL
jgi:nitrogen fixation/metabolism regulation signal transduction histidine kinase